MVTEAVKALSAEEISELCTRHTLYDWSAQAGLKPMAVASAKGVHFTTVDGRRFIDFNSQLMSVNAGHGDRRIIDAIKRQAEQLPYITPFMAHEPRARLGQKLAELLPGDIDKVLFTLARRRRQRERDQDRSHGDGPAEDPGALPLLPRLDRQRDPGHRRPAPLGQRILERRRARARSVPRHPARHRLGRGCAGAAGGNHSARGSFDDCRVHPRADHGTNGILIPPDGYLQGVRELCDRFGILMICDEVMTGFGRTGRWFGVDHWGVVPDLITLAKGLTSSYVPLGAVGMRPKVAAYFDDHVFYGGLTYNSHPLGCAAALGCIQAYEEDDMVGNAQRMGAVLAEHHRKLQERHPCVGATRSIGLFGALELVRDRKTMEPLAPFNGTSPEMKAIGQALLDAGLFTFLRWNTIMTNPPAVHHRGRAGRRVRDPGFGAGNWGPGSDSLITYRQHQTCGIRGRPTAED